MKMNIIRDKTQWPYITHIIKLADPPGIAREIDLKIQLVWSNFFDDPMARSGVMSLNYNLRCMINKMYSKKWRCQKNPNVNRIFKGLNGNTNSTYFEI